VPDLVEKLSFWVRVGPLLLLKDISNIPL